ncbi:MAG: tRNA uridine-5-carboxymethylaminomethyl(34) synthesis GTPase MnmE [Alistipes sp.]|nr:tRNA uridine-5-carboxymethylaminomethyl(34) synthesis GTPase MnmE [Alistipes sp.]
MSAANDTIVAPASATGGAIAVIRLSGHGAIACCDRVFCGRAPLCEAAAGTLHYGRIAEGGRTLDDVVAAVYRAPRSYTGEDSVEISCHGSRYIVSEIIALLLRSGARMARPGEFTTRAFLAGKLDLSQAEAVADLIAADSRAAHAMASTQMRGGYSSALDALREELLQLGSLLELELDFSEEEVEFADRGRLRGMMERIGSEIGRLTRSFSLGNAIKEGVAVAIVGEPNVGKSTLLNRLLGEERALVSEVAGTTRDTIEERLNIDGVLFRFIDTAGLHATDDRLEQLGIDRTHQAIGRARIVLQLVDATRPLPAPLPLGKEQTGLLVVNKSDAPHKLITPQQTPPDTLFLSARTGEGIEELQARLRTAIDTDSLFDGDPIVSNSRHLEALAEAAEALERALTALDETLPADLLAEEIRLVAHHLGTITGRITNDDILARIFSKFCIGK